MVQLQDSISEHMHHHTLYNMFFDKINEAFVLEIYHILALAYNLTSFFSLSIIFPDFSTTLQMQLGLPHSSIEVIL